MDDVGAMRITVTENGPYHVEGSVPLASQTIVANAEGDSIDWAEGEPIATEATYDLCRCGGSSHKPFCDGTHRTNGFDGTETASREPYADQAVVRRGPRLRLLDAPPLCASGRFCDPGGGVWRLATVDDDRAEHRVREQTGHCPSGRLVAARRDTGDAYEPDLAPSIGPVADPAQGVAGPLWVRGGVRVVAADGTPYETRNRVTLCRCGASQNKPFCDGSHVTINFQA